jgi:hypothetical protein
MRAGIVRLSQLAKARTWSVSHFLGDKPTLDGEGVEAAERQLKAAQTRLANAKEEQATEQARVEQLKRDGVVIIE